MKKLLLMASVFSLALSSCKKENFVERSSSKLTKSTEAQTSSTSSNNSGVTNQNGTLSFDSYQDLMNTIEYLENALDNHVSEYILPLEQEGYDEDQITQKMIEDNFFMFQPLLDFESSLGFNSLRQEFWQIENDWIQAGGSNASDPNNDMVLDKIAQTIVDPNYNVIIGGNTINMFELNNSGEKSNCQKTDRESGLTSIDSKHRLKTWVGLQHWGGSTTRHYAEAWYQYKSGSTWLGGITRYSMLIGQDSSPGGFSHLYDCSNQEFGLVPNNYVGIANRGYTVRSSWTSDATRFSYRGEDLFENAGWIVRLGGMYHHKF